MSDERMHARRRSGLGLAGAGALLLSLLSAVSCGRIGYDPISTDTSPRPDAAVGDRGIGGDSGDGAPMDRGNVVDGGSAPDAVDALIAPDGGADAGGNADTGGNADGGGNGGDGAAMPDAGGSGSCAPSTLCTLVDGFDQPTLASNLQAYSDGACSTAISGGAFSIMLSGVPFMYCGLTSVGTLMADGTLTIDSSGFPTTIVGLIIHFRIQDPSSYVEFQLTGTTLKLNVNSSGTTTQKGSLTYSSVTHRYWRFQANAASIAYQTSPDGNTWTTQATTPPPFTSTTVQMDIGAAFQLVVFPVTITLPGVNAP